MSMFFLFKDVQALSELLYVKGYLPLSCVYPAKGTFRRKKKGEDKGMSEKDWEK